MSFDFSGVNVPATVWVSFNAPSGSLGIGAGGSPTVGATAGYNGNRTVGAGPWSMFGSGQADLGIRVTALPAPATLTLAAVCPWLRARRLRFR